MYSVSQTPQVWVNVFAREQHGGLLVQIDGVDELFPDGLLDAVVDGYRAVLDALLDEPAWSATTFDLLPDDQRARRRAANDTAGPVPDDMLPDAFIARRHGRPHGTGGAHHGGDPHLRRASAAGLRTRRPGCGPGRWGRATWSAS